MRKSLFSKAILPAILFLSFFSIIMTSCEVGMGESVDLEAPVLKITSPGKNKAYVARNFTLIGTVVDNRAVDKVVIDYSYSDTNDKDEVITRTGNTTASVSGTSWQADFSFKKDFEINFTITAYDKMGNTSEDSVKMITVTVDAEDPAVDSFTVRRNNSYSVNMCSKEELDSKKIEDSGSKDYFQNEEFTICASLTDNYVVNSSTLSLFDESGNLILGPIPTDGVKANDNDRNEYSPEFTITQAALGAAYNTGKHYIKPIITVYDEAGNFHNYEEGFFCWWPERDVPYVTFPLKNSDGKIQVGTGTALPFSVFDDDGITKIEAKLITADAWDRERKTNNKTIEGALTAIATTDIKAKKEKTITGTETLRDVQITSISDAITATDAGSYYLVIKVEDKKVINTASKTNKIGYYEIPTLVDSMDIPILVVESPTENTSPALTNKTFELKAYTLDDKAISKIAIAWLPAGTDAQVTKAKVILDGYAASKFANNKTETVTDGIKIYTPTTSQTTDSSINKIKNSFSQTFNVTDYFKVGSTLKNETKVFLIYVKDTDDHVVTKTYRLGAYTTAPTLDLKYSADNSTWTDFNSTNIENEQNKIYFKVKPIGANGLSINASTVTIKGKFGNGSQEDKKGTADSEGYYSFSYTPSKEGRYEITIEAEDVLGNKIKQTNIVSFNEKAVLQSITATNKNGKPLVAGDVLEIQARFSSNVTVTGSPYIALQNTGVSDSKATFDTSSNNSDTLIFKYTVPTGADSKDVAVNTNANPITVPTGSSITGEWNKTVNVLTAKKTIKIDAVAPTVKTVPTTVTKSGTSGTLTIEFSENVTKQTGTITIERTANWRIPPVISESVFQQIYASSTNTNKIRLIGSSNGKPALKDDSLTPAGPYKKYTQGLEVSGTGNNAKYVPNTKTKYVLDYDYNLDSGTPSGRSVSTTQLREALEDVGYHKTTIDVSSSVVTVNEKNVSIQIKDSDFIDGFKNGVEYKISITASAFCDSAGNPTAVISGHTFYTDKVATPYIRVNRITSNGSNTTLPATTTTVTEGKVFVRIDSETPDVKINYFTATKTKEITRQNSGKRKSENGHNYIDDFKTSELNKTVTTPYNAAFQVGDGKITTGQKIGIKAVATKDGYTNSDADYEGAFKTLCFYERPQHNETFTTFLFYGCDTPEGAPSVSGFPLMQNGSNGDRNYRKGYKLNIGDTNEYAYILISWEIICDYTIQTHTTNYQNAADPTCTYGEALYTYRQGYYGYKSDED